MLGIGGGLLFAFLVTESLGDLGLGFEPPPAQPVVLLVLAVVVGVLAAALPAAAERAYRCSRRCAPSRART